MQTVARTSCRRVGSAVGSGTLVGVGAMTPTYHCQRRFGAHERHLSQDEYDHLNQPLPPPELLKSMRSKDTAPSGVQSEEIKVPGDSFGIMRNRSVFHVPLERPEPCGEWKALFPKGMDPRLGLNPVIGQRWCGQHGLSPQEVVALFREHHGDVNAMVHSLAKRRNTVGSEPFGSYSLVAMESYVPETFCFINVVLPSFSSTQDENVLEAIHELVLSAAELPVDTPRQHLVDALRKWSVEDGRLCQDVMDEHGITVTDVLLLPHGEYSAQGFYVFNAQDSLGFPNVGSAVAACCLDLRTGIHNRFRFHVERIADTFSDHAVHEALHIGQDAHILRQPFWFQPDYSVEEYLRFKESLLQPSASIFELRFAMMFASGYGLASYRNLIEMEKLKIAQHKYEKHYEDFTSPGNWLTSDHSQLQTVAAGGGGSSMAGAYMHRETNTKQSEDTAMTTRVSGLRNTLKDSIQRHGDKALARFYRDNLH